MTEWKLIIHGGAKEIAPEEEADNRDGLAEAIEAGRAILADGGRAIDAVEASVRVLERLPVFNAGRGSDPTIYGNIEMCSAIMDGASLDIGGVIAIERVCHPVSVAKALLREQPILLAGQGATRFAEQMGAELCTLEELRTADPPSEEAEMHDTVGAVALDRNGDYAAATSTGGLAGQLPGRAGDSAMPGCGYYAENGVGAVALSGHGEGIARLRLASKIMHSMNGLGPERAIYAAVSEMERVGGDAGGVAIDAQGRIGWAHNSPHFAVASIAEGDNSPGLWLRKQGQ
ncbi:asparaginase [Sphingomonas sp. ID1715]|uniref:isoaspartyl peptidase/L-asparaginase family protein n=1 Tax=Sphingomonas sp. ID1715 TaxID=1656898 RepID=UPI00148781E2|nr:isoaspartyl peptidase/L-asparaginase family protein [Sphingomonas sp. ID1715]NNM76149.1 asparaginase [Sphingomonas sp. ID1715]